MSGFLMPMKNTQLQDTLSISGKYHFFSLPKQTKESSPVIDTLREIVRGKSNLAIPELKKLGFIVDHKVACNLIPTTGREVLTRRLAGDVTYSGEVDYGALGSGSSAFTVASTQLNSEVYRKQAASQAYEDNIAYIDWFIASGDVANQTFNEFGAFIDGTGSANSGQAWSLLLTGGWVKSGSMFISAAYTLTQS